jgi:hypothetical protein
MHDLRWYNNKYHLWNEVYYINDMWRGAEHNDESGVNDVCEFSVFVIAEWHLLYDPLI